MGKYIDGSSRTSLSSQRDLKLIRYINVYSLQEETFSEDESNGFSYEM